MALRSSIAAAELRRESERPEKELRVGAAVSPAGEAIGARPSGHKSTAAHSDMLVGSALSKDGRHRRVSRMQHERTR